MKTAEIKKSIASARATLAEGRRLMAAVENHYGISDSVYHPAYYPLASLMRTMGAFDATRVNPKSWQWLDAASDVATAANRLRAAIAEGEVQCHNPTLQAEAA